MRARRMWLLRREGQAIVEYTLLVGLLGLALAAAIANVGDQIADIWNDLMEDMDAIDDGVADMDLVFPQSDIDESGETDTEDGGFRDELGAGGVPPI